jgi:hypothetical protein
VTLVPAVLAGRRVTATATNEATGDTSGFSAPVAVTAADADHDGMPDAYESARGLNAGEDDALLDADGDGGSNLSEYLAGTDPRNGAELLRAISVARSGGGLAIKFRVVPGHAYQVEESATLAPAAWRILEPVRSATTDELEVVVPSISGAPRAFYRALLLE